MEPKEVLNNFLKEDPLLTAIKEAYEATYSKPRCSRAYVVREILEKALAEHEDEH